ncbi:MAG: MFS transporter [Dehalococcoidia bacterium]
MQERAWSMKFNGVASLLGVTLFRGLEPWRRNLYVLWLSQFASIVSFSLAFPFIPLFIQTLGVDDPRQAAFWGGVSFSAMGFSMFFASPIWGILGDRFGRKKNVLRALFGSAVLVGVTGLSPNVPILVILRFFTGMVTGTVPTVMALVASMTPRHKIGFSISLMQMALFTGLAIGPLVGGVLAGTVGFRATFFVSGIGLAIIGILVLLAVRESFQRPQGATTSEGPVALLRGFFTLATSRTFLPVLALILLVQSVPVTILPVLPVFIRELSPESSTVAAGIAFGVLSAASSVASLVVAQVGQRLGLKRVLIGAAWLGGIAYLPFALVQSVPQVVALVAVTGFAQGAMLSSAMSLVGTLVPPRQHSQAFGALQSVFSLAIGTGPLLGGVLATTLGLRAVFLVDGVLLLVVGVVAFRLVSAKGQEEGGEPSPPARSG